MPVQRKGGKKGDRKFGRNSRRPGTAKRKARILKMNGMMGRKIRALMKHNCMTQAQAMKHWKKNRKRGLVRRGQD
jgi:hypothetical protein